MKKREIVGNVLGRTAHRRNRLAAAGAVDAIMQRGAINDTEFVGSRVGHGEQASVARASHPGGIRGTQIDVI